MLLSIVYSNIKLHIKYALLASAKLKLRKILSNNVTWMCYIRQYRSIARSFAQEKRRGVKRSFLSLYVRDKLKPTKWSLINSMRSYVKKCGLTGDMNRIDKQDYAPTGARTRTTARMYSQTAHT